ncbi:MAG: Ig-like domain-containing protein [Bacteroidaceae bacterium]|nr:Ig-like domain-containing protein [Bacteroidaceae bacterium]
MTYLINVVDVKSISIPSSISLCLDDTYTFLPAITDVGATTTFTWLSSNTSVATIDSNGTICATGLGTTIITCTAHNGVYAQCEVTVNPVMVSGITLNEIEADLTVGERLQLEAMVVPENTTDKSVTWSSTNEAVAVVSESGMVTAVGSGTCQIKATANDGSGKTASCLLTVEKNNKLTVTDMTQCSGGRGVLNVLLSDEETIMGFQFDLQLPAGVNVAENEGKLLAQLTGNAVNTHSISSTKISEGLYRFIVTPQGSRAISNTSGDGMTITIDVADDLAVGTYDMTIKDIEMTVRKAGNVYEDIHPKNSTATLTVTEAMMGDVNGDGRVSVTDVISMNSFILEEEPAQFIRKVADLNGDGKITITDMVQVIDIILGR